MRRYPILFIMLLLSFVAFSNNFIEVTIGAGYTFIDLDTLVENDENEGAILRDWDQLNYGISIQYFYFHSGSIHIGTELLYQQLYWYQVKIPYGSQPIIREYNVAGISGSVPVRVDLGNNLSVDVGPMITFLNLPNFGLFSSINYLVPLSNDILIPVKLRMDIRNGLEPYLPISINAGVIIVL